MWRFSLFIKSMGFFQRDTLHETTFIPRMAYIRRLTSKECHDRGICEGRHFIFKNGHSLFVVRRQTQKRYCLSGKPRSHLVTLPHVIKELNRISALPDIF